MEQNARPAAADAITYQWPGDDAAEPLVAPVVPYGAPDLDNQSVGRSGSSSSFRLPHFWTVEPSLWFRQAESSFRRLNITASFTKYNLVLEALPQDVIISIRDLVNTITESTHMPYQQLKYRLLSSYSPSLVSHQQVAGYNAAWGPPAFCTDGLHALLAAAGRARGIAVSRPFSPPSAPGHARSPLHQAV